ncbi:MAG: DUF5700 domain-containing putative Zn-dependent protease [Gemmatimonadaceae bacterium]
MPRKSPRFPAIVFVVLALAGGLALVQMGRHRVQANDAIRGVSAQNACTSARANVGPPRTASGSQHASAVILRLDYAGAEALINALERDALSDADVDSLLRIPGLCAVVANVPRFFPQIGVSEFRNEIREFARTKKGGKYDGYFRLGDVWQSRSTVRTLIAAIQTNERTIVDETLAQLERYRPDSGTLAITAYFVAGGVSDGFAFENDPRSFYANLVTADGDLNGVVLNMAHEAYHVMQVRAQVRTGINPLWLSTDTMPPVERLFAGTLAEGTATYAADPTRSTATGSNMESARQRYRRNSEPKRIAENFARFDAVLMGLRRGRMTWEKAYMEGFTSDNDASFYFVGYEMARALERYCGRECIGQLFEEQPIEFFRRYIALSHKHAELSGRFSRETEAFIASYRAKPTN